MWDAVKEAIKSTGGTVRFIVIVVVLITAAVITWRLLGGAAPDLFATITRILGGRPG